MRPCRSFFISLHWKLKNDFLLALRKVQCFRRPTPPMRNAGDHHIALPNHPLVSFDDSVAGRHVLKRWVGGVIVAGGIRFPVEVGQNQNGRDVGIDRLLPPHRRRCQTVKVSVAAEVKCGRAALNQRWEYYIQLLREIAGLIYFAVSTERDNHPHHPHSLLPV